jgi:GntR family transcriptional regulator/MocR family aminotransferase
MEFAIPLSRTGGPLFRQVYTGLRNAILVRAFPPGDRLPSTRDLAEQLGISRTVVLLAYDQLLAEGFVVGRGGSGTYVADCLSEDRPRQLGKPARIKLSRFGEAASAASGEALFPDRRSSRRRINFTFGQSDTTTFPFDSWQKILTRKAREVRVSELDYGPAAGLQVLREAICTHLRRSRAVVCDPSQVIVVNGSQQALDLVARVLVEPGDRVAIEDPQYLGTREVLRAAGARLIPVPVDRDGLDTAKLPKQAGIAFVTPSHHFPTGAILSLPRRLALLEWARRKNAVIVENDYDGEFHYQGRPLESLQGLDTDGRVLYLGTFSRTVFPALRIGYLVVPSTLVSTFTKAKWLNDQHSATLEQQTLAEFIANGMYERHLRRLRRRNAARRKVLLDSIERFLGDRVEVTGDGSGTHIVLWPRKRTSEAEVIADAASRGVGIFGTSYFYLAPNSRSGLMLGYSTMNENEIERGIKLLSDTF